MKGFKDYYKILQIHNEADIKMIDSAYRCLSKQYHPDLNKASDAHEKMREINEAYAVLGDNAKRKEYDINWRRFNSSKSMSSLMGNLDYKVELAQAVLDDFFKNTIFENWNGAYQKLTDADKKNVSLGDFIEWKLAVSKLHKLANYKIKYEKSFQNCEYLGNVYSVIMQFTVEMNIMEIATGQISIEKAKKYIVYNGDSCKLCLGYTDIKPVIAKFNYLSMLKAKSFQSDRIRILNYYELLEDAKKELERKRRYNNEITLILLTVSPKPSDMIVSEESYLEKCMSYVSKVLSTSLRKTDIVGRYHESSFAIILTETDIKQGRAVMSKVVQSARRPRNLNFSLHAACTDCNSTASMEDILKAALRKAAPEKIKNELSYFA